MSVNVKAGLITAAIIITCILGFSILGEAFFLVIFVAMFAALIFFAVRVFLQGVEDRREYEKIWREIRARRNRD